MRASWWRSSGTRYGRGGRGVQLKSNALGTILLTKFWGYGGGEEDLYAELWKVSLSSLSNTILSLRSITFGFHKQVFLFNPKVLFCGYFFGLEVEGLKMEEACFRERKLQAATNPISIY